MDERGLTVLQMSPGEERIVGGDEHLGDPPCRDQVDVVWNAYGLGCADRDELRISATFDQEHGPVPDGDRLDTGPDARNHARGLEPEDVAGTGRGRIESLALEQVCAVDAGTSDADDDLTLTSDWIGALLDVQLLGATRPCYDDRTQRSATPVSRGGGQETWPEREELPTGPVHTGPSPAVLENAAKDSCQSPSPSE